MKKPKKTPTSVTVNRRAHYVMRDLFRREKITFSLVGTGIVLEKCLQFEKTISSSDFEKRQFLWKIRPACRVIM